MKTHCSSLFFLKIEWNLPRKFHFLICLRNGWIQNKMNLFAGNLLHVRNTSFWISFNSVFRFNVGVVSATGIVFSSSVLKRSGWECWNFIYKSHCRWFFNYRFKFKLIFQRSVNFADLRVQNCVISKLTVQILLNSQL